MDSKPRFLLVDDEPAILKLVSKRLKAEGYEVSLAQDGDEALRKGLNESNDLIILDVMLPKRDGFEVCRALKNTPKTKDVPIILFTAKTQGSDVKTGMDCGADDYVCKPFRAQELLERIRHHLKKGTGSG